MQVMGCGMSYGIMELTGQHWGGGGGGGGQKRVWALKSKSYENVKHV